MHVNNLMDKSPVLQKIVTLAERNGVRLPEFFRDFDRLNHGECPSSALNCISTQLNLNLTRFELEELCKTYPSHTPKFFNYRCFLSDARRVEFDGQRDLDRTVTSRAPPCISGIARVDDSELDGLQVIAMIQAQVYEKHVELRGHFRDFDRLRKGVVPACKLRCVLSLLNIQVTEAEVTSLTKTYVNDDNMIDYLRLCSDIERDLICKDLETDPSGQPPPPFDLALAKEGKKPTLSASETDVLTRTEEMIRRTSRQRGINPLPQFRDFDRYNRLVITDSQFKRTMKTLGFDISEPEYDIILKKYCLHDSPHRFSYREFCRAIESL